MNAAAFTELAALPGRANTAAADATADASALLDVARAYVIDSPELFEAAGEELRTITTRRKKLEEARLSITRPMDEAKKAVMALFARPLEVLEEAESVLRTGMLEWKRKRDAEEAEARRKAEEEARLERERLAREQAAAEEAARKAREEAAALAAQGDDEAAVAAELAAEEAIRRASATTAALELAEVAPVAVVTTTPKAKAEGVATRKNWKAEVVDFPALVKAAAEALARGDTTLMGYLEPNTQALGGVAKALKDQARIPGVRVYAEESLAVRRA